MYTFIEAAQNKNYHDLNYIKLPPKKVKIDFSVTAVKAEGNLSSEIKYVKDLIKGFSTNKILVY